ncbi:MAG: IS982 family transposase [Bacteroidaceae bacterium]|nr:IS982 family transposase [Bacteroidaceae bacterium]
MSLIFSTLSSVKTTKHYYRRYAQLRHKFQKILEICKKFAGNQVDEKGNVPRCGFVPTFSDLEVVALSITAEALSIDSENYLFKRLNSECPGAIPNLITRRQYNRRRKKTMLLGESIRQTIAKAIDGGEDVFSIDSKPVKVCQNARASRCQMGRDDIEHAPAWGYCASQNMYYGYKLHALCGVTGVIHSYDMTAANVHDLQYLKDVQREYHDCTILGDKGYLSAPVQLDLFETANITLDVPYKLNQKNWTPSTWAYKRFRKRIETVFSQFDGQFMMIRNYAKKPSGLYTRMAAKVAAFTMLQYFNLLNHRPIGQVKYALF